ncbi:ComEC/Rec2 family competence protein [Pseudomonas asplenii]|uniref:Metallo-beta-lactamase domain-containing protein n=1 Tax=Pseudomonas asplenii TaxID=53407 RepID=A0A1H6NUH2_9PSED|nr:hypothetical protein [Pseudomonas fuscovaginae]SEI20215.1 hypothetical protein SAMN05216581_4162 [Pseudomonas fuscovaginae]
MPLKFSHPDKTETSLTSVTSPDEVRVLSFNVGHGDCTLVESVSDGSILFRCLLDAGMKVPPELITYLEDTPRDRREPDIDVLVLSHVDADHQGGLPELLASKISIGQYLGPCLPTFERLKWLFAPRVSEAVTKASKIEQTLKNRGIPITYPLEGFKTRFANGRITLSILSPAAKLMKRLSLASANDVAAIMRRRPLPLQWLLEALDDQDDDQDENMTDLFDGRVALSPEDFENYPLTRNLPQKDSVMQTAQATQPELEPDFFGNSILNDTSLVVVLDIVLDGHHRKRLLFPGDQENWTYIAAQHPAGLGIDVLKAPHHGGRVYLNDGCESFHTLYAWLRPKTVMVSANGRHNLPRAGFREALRAVGGALLCPNIRTFEPLSAGAVLRPDEKSCFAALGCTQSLKPFITMKLSATVESADTPTCVQGSGHSGLAPIVVLRQDVTVPSEGLLRYTYGELERHSRWISKQLKQRRKAFLTRAGASKHKHCLTAEQLTTPWSLIATLAKAEGRHDLVADPDPVLKFGRSHHTFWVDKPERYQVAERQLACLPSGAEIKAATRWLKTIPKMLLIVDTPKYFNLGVDRLSILGSVDWRVFDHLLAAELALPYEVIAEEIRPKLLTLIEKRFSFKICRFDYQYSRYDGSQAYLFLDTDPSTVPDLESAQWKDIWSWHPYGKDFKAPWPELASLAQNELMAGNFFSSYDQINRGLFFSGPHENSRDYYSFPERFQAAQWMPL